MLCRNQKLDKAMEEGLPPEWINRYRDKVEYSAWKRAHPGMAKRIAENARLKGIHKGERCFILGNGPSIAGEDLSRLQGEKLFGVNLYCLGERFQDLALSYWICLDGVFFYDSNFSNDIEDTIKVMDHLCSMKQVECFVPWTAYDFIRGRRYDKKLAVHYMGPCRKVMYHSDPAADNPFHLDKNRYFSYSVLIDAITIAVHMGFSEIYLLGCDASVIKSRIEIFWGDSLNAPLHSYSFGNEEQKFKKQVIRQGIVHELKTEYYCFSNWEYIYRYCVRHGIKLINLSSKTLLDFIPRMRYMDLLERLGL